MINLFYVPGMFGSTLEYVLSNYTQEHIPIIAEICRDGSLHSYYKQAHINDTTSLINFVNNKKLYKISTPFYPLKELHLPEILSKFDLTDADHNILMYADSLADAELNLLFQYYKVVVGDVAPKGLELFSSNNSHNIKNWNSNYTSWNQMQIWEWREWFSLFYVGWVQEWQQSANQVPEYFLKIKNTDLLFKTEQTLIQIIDFCNLTIKSGLSKFVKEWQHKQQYIVDEYQLLDQIIDSTITQQSLTWQPTNIVSEAIVQQRLRAVGYEIRCDGLDTFPTDSTTLYNLLEKC